MSSYKLFTEPSFSNSPHKISLDDSVFLIGSCFSENVHLLMKQRKFHTMSNPSGILFDVFSIERCISNIYEKTCYKQSDLFLYNELFGSWGHHSSFSDTDESAALAQINDSIIVAHDFLKNAKQVFITLGSAFSYYHIGEKKWVANCHKVPQTQFKKELISIDKILSSLENIYSTLLNINPDIKLTLTISPVRHLRDGVIDNNRSKARLTEAVNLFTQHHTEVYYFPSYEIVIDVLRDYRFFDIDFAHPNYLATNIVFDYFKNLCIDPKSFDDMDKFYQLHLAMNHKAKHSETSEHKNFIRSYIAKINEYVQTHPHIDFTTELHYFEEALKKLEVRS